MKCTPVVITGEIKDKAVIVETIKKAEKPAEK